MAKFRSCLLFPALAVVALASSPASADLFIWANTNGGNNSGNNCSGISSPNFCSATNTTLNGAATVGGWSFSVTLGGTTDEVLPDIFNINNLDFTGSGSLTLYATETNLNFGSAVNILSVFDTLNITNTSETRWLYLDPSNSGLTTTLLGCVSNAGVSGCKNDAPLTITQIQALVSGLSGDFSLTEEISVSSSGSGQLQSEDEENLLPEPMSLTLFGSGLLALGAVGRRRRKTPKSA